MAEAIVVDQLTKVYEGRLGDQLPAVKDVSFSVREGEIFGFIGPNGAGKTTTIKTMLGLLFPTLGSVTVLGRPAGDIETKKRISYLPESPYFYEHMTGVEVLDFYCKLFRLNTADRKRKVPELLEMVGLAKDGKRSLRQYSKGMLQRIGIAQALINDPDLLFLDEPTSGLDPIAHKDIRDTIVALRELGKTVFLSSHQLSDVEMVCDRVAIINRGELVKIGALDDLLLAGRTVITVTKPKDGFSEAIKKHAERVSVDGDHVRIYVDSEENVHNVLALARDGATLISVVPQRQTLEDLFVEIVREVKK